MSWPALGWASKQKPGRVADKMVLIALADRHNEDNDLAWPSLAWLCEFCCLDRKTVIAALDRLQSAGFIADSGKRAGRTGQVKAYTLALNSPEITIPKTEPLNSPVFPEKQSQKRNPEPSIEPSTPVSSNDDTPPAPILELVVENDPPAKPILKPSHVQEAWNAMAVRVGLPTVRGIDGTRERKLRGLIAKYAIEDFTEAIAAVDRADWMHGANARGWRANFNFFLAHFTELLEGTYDKSAA